MKPWVSFVLVMVLLLSSQPARTQTVEMSNEFKALIKELAKEEFRTYIFDALKRADPVIAASTYDLIERSVSGDSAGLIANQVILSMIDYSMFIELEASLKASIPLSDVAEQEGAMVASAAYERLIKVGVLLAYEKIARDHYMIVSIAIRRMLTEETDFITQYSVQTGSESMKFEMAVYRYMIQQQQFITAMLQKKQILKDVITVAMTSDTAALNHVRAPYQQITGKEFSTTREMMKDVLGHIMAAIDTIYYTYDILKDVRYATLYRDLAPYVYNVVWQRTHQIPINHEHALTRALISKLSTIHSETKNGVEYVVGLWAGMFFDGSAWSPPSSNAIILSLRLNDRLQYTFAHSADHQTFIYIGGFVDVALKELTKSSANEFVFTGIGYRYRSTSWTVSGFVPLGSTGIRGGIVLTTMYELPLTKILGVFN